MTAAGSLPSTAYVGMGSNLGDRFANLQKALEKLKNTGRLRVTAVSSVYETEPVGGPPQDMFLNAAVALRTALSPVSLLRRLLEIENELGRVRRERWGPRTVDLDLLLYDELIMKTPLLELPHPRLAERVFVLLPLVQLAPDLKVPSTGKTVRELLAALDHATGIRRFPRDL